MKRNEARKFESNPRHELDAVVYRFFAEIRKKDGHGCKTESLAVMQCSLERCLKNWQKLQCICKFTEATT